MAILLAASGWHKEKSSDSKTVSAPAPPPLPTDVTPPPPASQFREGDRWRSWGFDAAGRQTNSFRTFYVHQGAWYALQGGIDNSSGPRDARSFQQLKDPVFYPAGATENDFFATIDGTLHRYLHGQWTDLPIGATLVDQRGTVYKVDVRVTAYEADQIQEAFDLTKPTFRAISLPMRARRLLRHPRGHPPRRRRHRLPERRHRRRMVPASLSSPASRCGSCFSSGFSAASACLS